MYQDEVKKWLDFGKLDPSMRAEIEQKTDAQLEDMFYTNLEFGTGGMRGILGAGTNRMNLYTIRKANAGLVTYLKRHFDLDALQRGVVIAHDNRHQSREFALESAGVLAASGIPSYLYDALRPTPELSFSVRRLGCIAGIVVTASHNPPNYNGYKIYDEYGCQYTPQYADEIIGYVNAVEDIFSVPTMSKEKMEQEGLLKIVSPQIDTDYLEAVKTVRLHPEIPQKIKVVFTSLHGTSAELGQRLLKECDVNYVPVLEQMIHDPNFSTVKSPNPENPSAFELAIQYGLKEHADLLIATDPDADRLGIAVWNGKEYVLLTGNQTGPILIYYLLSQKQRLGLLSKEGVVFNTVVTSDLGAKIARSFGMEVISTLTGFKFIGEQARLLEGTSKQFEFGYEESFGYVIKDFVRDKDSLQALLFTIDAANYYHVHEGKTLLDVLAQINEIYGAHYDALQNIELFGKEGKERIDRIMTAFRLMNLKHIAGESVVEKWDFETQERHLEHGVEAIHLPKSNVIKFILSSSSWFVLRPSGTEPKLKVYYSCVKPHMEDSKAFVDHLKQAVSDLISAIE